MILQGPDIQPEPSEKVRSPENIFEYVSDSLFFIPELLAQALPVSEAVVNRNLGDHSP